MKMKALVKSKPEPGIWLEEVAVPEIGINDVLIKIHKTSICGTDLHIYNWDAWAKKTIPVPMQVGHEFVGVVDKIGSNVRDFKPGNIVSGEGHLVCGRCRNCLAGRRHLCMKTSGVGVNRPGAFAEYLSIPVTNVWYCDPNIPMDILSCFDPLGNATHTALSFDVLGEDILITGAGPIGCMATAIAKLAGARYVVVTDINPYRLNIAKKMGATLTLDVRKAKIEDASTEPLVLLRNEYPEEIRRPNRLHDLVRKLALFVQFPSDGHDLLFGNPPRDIPYHLLFFSQ